MWVMKRPFCIKSMVSTRLCPVLPPIFALVRWCSIFCVRRHQIETESTQLWAIRGFWRSNRAPRRQIVLCSRSLTIETLLLCLFAPRLCTSTTELMTLYLLIGLALSFQPVYSDVGGWMCKTFRQGRRLVRAISSVHCTVPHHPLCLHFIFGVSSVPSQEPLPCDRRTVTFWPLFADALVTRCVFRFVVCVGIICSPVLSPLQILCLYRRWGCCGGARAGDGDDDEPAGWSRPAPRARPEVRGAPSAWGTPPSPWTDGWVSVHPRRGGLQSSPLHPSGVCFMARHFFHTKRLIQFRNQKAFKFHFEVAPELHMTK